MKPLGRKVDFWSIIKRLPDFGKMFFRSLVIFQNPITLWFAYIRGQQPPGNAFHLRNGMRIHLSNNEHDSITVMVIFCRREYGKINHGTTIIDIGANIGVFSLYAAWSGAKKVISVEPNLESFQTLQKNIAINNLANVIFPLQKAIGDKDDEEIFIPASSSPYNKVSKNIQSNEGYQRVLTISLKSVLESKNINYLNLLKMDCEGAEYDVLYNLENKIYENIDSIRMEHHKIKEKDNLIGFLNQRTFQVVNDKNMILWFNKFS